MKRALFLLIIWLVIMNAWLYKTNYFHWQNKLHTVVDFISHLDEKILDNKSLALRQARPVVDDALTSSGDISDGPCLKEELIPNWSLDLVHHPREDADDELQNQCYNYITGKTRHLIEFDLRGNFIGIKE